MEKIKVVQDVLKHILVLDFLKSDEILEIVRGEGGGGGWCRLGRFPSPCPKSANANIDLC